MWESLRQLCSVLVLLESSDYQENFYNDTTKEKELNA